MKKRGGERALDIGILVILILMALVTLYPLWYVLIASVSSPTAIANGEVLFLPKGFNLDAYRKLIENKQLWIGYRNSILYTVAGVLVDLAVMTPCAYALSRKTLPFRSFLMTLFLITMYFSGGMIPMYMLLNKIGFVNSPLALIVPGCVVVFDMIILRSFFEANIPDSLVEAAMIDGSSHIRFFAQIAMPISPAVLAVVALYSIQRHWNAYLGAQMYIYKPKYYTLQQVLRQITATLDGTLSETLSVDELAKMAMDKELMKYAVVIVACIPLIIIYPFVQRFFVKGVMVGA
ncbi:MAG: carbohydrate ABC transporter permease, partial [Anaerotignum sp.]|nr:carbohydrate ABC transporter permease [Anaerotignum sp.]